MKIKLRKSKHDDLESIYELHQKCFNESDQWYKSIIAQYLHNGYVLELVNNKIIGVLLQGDITPCNNEASFFCNDENSDSNNFMPTNIDGEEFLNTSKHIKEHYGITMICIDNKYRGKGLAKRLIGIHIKDNPKKLLCLNTRKSNTNAYELYKKMDYQQIALIKNKYFTPNEDSIFMVHGI
jgi:ribosomal protein S18 acetylase RimI-like enzyme